MYMPKQQMQMTDTSNRHNTQPAHIYPPAGESRRLLPEICTPAGAPESLTQRPAPQKLAARAPESLSVPPHTHPATGAAESLSAPPHIPARWSARIPQCPAQHTYTRQLERQNHSVPRPTFTRLRERQNPSVSRPAYTSQLERQHPQCLAPHMPAS